MTIWQNTGWLNDNNTGRAFKGTTVFVKNNDVNKALRKFKKRLQDEGWFNELREREHYTSPSERKRKNLASAQVRERKRQSQWKSES
jgi:small subunit ribosomal protein S21